MPYAGKSQLQGDVDEMSGPCLGAGRLSRGRGLGGWEDVALG